MTDFLDLVHAALLGRFVGTPADEAGAVVAMADREISLVRRADAALPDGSQPGRVVRLAGKLLRYLEPAAVAHDASMNIENLWQAVQQRDRTQDGRFYFGVITTGVSSLVDGAGLGGTAVGTQPPAL